MQKKQKPRRNNIRYPNLKTNYNLKTRADLLDFDYIAKLDRSELKFLDEFCQGYVAASFREDSMFEVKNKRKAYKANNVRNKDAYTICKAAGILVFGKEYIGNRFLEETTPEKNLENKDAAKKLKKEILDAFIWDARAW